MQYKKGEALANHDKKALDWCARHSETLRKIEHSKFDEVTAFILEYMDVHTKLTAEEIKAAEANKRSNTRGGDNNRKQFLELIEHTEDLVFAIWANVQGKNKLHLDIPLANMIAQLPQKQANI